MRRLFPNTFRHFLSSRAPASATRRASRPCWRALIPFAVFIVLAPLVAAFVLWIAGTLLLWADHWDWRTPVGTAAMVLGYSPFIFILGFPPAAVCTRLLRVIFR